MPMPKTPIHKNGKSNTWQNDIGRTWQLFLMSLKLKSNLFEQIYQAEFGRSRFPLYPRHNL